MARRIKQAPSIDVFNIVDSKPLLEAKIHVITPMFGGGWEAGEVDKDLPVTAKSVRGHLRFWWRACNAHRFETSESLFEKEAEIWGQAARKSVSHADSQVDVLIEDLDAGKPTANNDDPASNGYPAYALWPFRGEARQGKPKTPPKAGRLDVSFRLIIVRNAFATLDKNDLLEAVNSAVWGWIMFGGIGARTRRGCGALWTDHKCFKLNASTAEEALCQLQKAAAIHIPQVSAPASPPLPMLHGSQIAFLKGTPKDRLKSWREAVNQMQDYRQGDPVGRTKRFGHSKWPEANSIRDLRSIPALDPNNPAARPFFPRAELGLPIVFHFKDNEMDDHTLQAKAEGATRMASPFILKPLAVSATKAFPLVLMLKAPLISTLQNELKAFEVKLIQTKDNKVLSAEDISSTDISDSGKAKKVKPLENYGGGNARTAFFEYIKRSSSTSGSLT